MANINEIVSQQAIDGIINTDKAITDLDQSTLEFVKTIEKLSAELKKGGIDFKTLSAAQKKNATQTKKLTELEKKQIVAEKELEKQRKAGIKTIQKQNLKLAQEEAVIKKVSKSVDDLKAKNKALLASRDRLDRSTKKGTAEFNRLTAALNRNQKAIARTRISTRGLSTAFRGMATSLVGALGLAGGLFAVFRVFGDVIRRIRTFDKAMQNIVGILGTTRKELSGLEKEIKRVAGESIKTSNEVAELATTLIVLGKSKEDVIKLLKPVNDLSIALQATSEEAGELLIQTLNAFGKGSESAQEYADIIAKMRTSTALDFERIKDALGFLAPVARVAGISFEKTGAILGVLVDNGIKAAKAGRLTASSFLRLAKKGLTLEDALDKVNEAQSRGIKETELLSLATNLFGVNAGAVGLILANNRGKVADLTKELENSKGTLETLTKEQLKALDAQFKILDSTWEKFILNIDSGSGIISTALRGIISFTIEAIKGFEALSDPIQVIVDRIKGINATQLAKNIKEDRKEVDALAKSFMDNGVPALEANKKAVNLLILQYIKLKETADFPVEIQKQIDALNAMRDKIIAGEDEIADKKKILTDEEIKAAERKAAKIISLEEELANKIFELTNDKETVKLKAIEDEAVRLKEAGVNEILIAEFVAEEKKKLIKEVKDAAIIAEQKFQDVIDKMNQDAIAKLKEKFNKEKEEKDKADDEEKERAEKIAELKNQLLDESIAAGFSIFQSDLDRKSMALEEDRARELKDAGENKEEQAKINAKFDKLQSAIKTKKAKADKLQAITEIAINTARAIISTLAVNPLPIGLPLLLLTAAIGAVQLAAVIAKPIPKFFKGTENAPKGLLIAGDRGSELIEPKSGKPFLVNKPTVLSGIEGARINTHFETKRILSSKNIGFDSRDLQEMVNSNKRIERAIKNQPHYHFKREKIIKRMGNYSEIYHNQKIKGV